MNKINICERRSAYTHVEHAGAAISVTSKKMEWGRGGKKKIMPILGSLDSSASPESENRGEEKKREEETGGGGERKKKK